jgi:large subunit ribosomal protein L4
MKLSEGNLKIVENWELDSHKTKPFSLIMEELANGGRVLVVDNPENQNLILASRNLSRVKFVPAHGVNIHDLLKYEELVISKGAVETLQEVLVK